MKIINKIETTSVTEAYQQNEPWKVRHASTLRSPLWTHPTSLPPIVPIGTINNLSRTAKVATNGNHRQNRNYK